MSHLAYHDFNDDPSSSSHNRASNHYETSPSQTTAEMSRLGSSNLRQVPGSETTLSHDQQQPISAWDDYGQLPELAPVELQSGRLDPDYAKEVVFPTDVNNATELSADKRSEDGHVDVVPDDDFAPDSKGSIEKRKRRRICGLPLGIVVCIAFTLVVLIAVGLGAGLHYGLMKNQSTGPSSSSGSGSGSGGGSGSGSNTSQPNPNYFSTTGAFNRSGWGFGQAGNKVTDPNGQTQLFFQHHSGQIRWLYQDAAGTWSGGDTAIASDAKNATPMGLITYTSTDVPTWYLYYIDTSNTIRQKVRDSTDAAWSEGPLSALGLVAMDDPYARLRVVYTGYVGPGSAAGAWGMQAFYTSDENTVSEAAWTSTTNQWVRGTGFPANARAGVGAVTWYANTTVQYALCADWNDDMRLLWRDVDSTATATATHPIGTWVNSSVSIPHALSTTDVSYTDYLVLQLDSGAVAFYNVTLDAENSVLGNQIFELQGADEAISGTQLWLSNLPIASADPQFTFIYQRNGSDITYLIRDYVTGEMAVSSLPIPNT